MSLGEHLRDVGYETVDWLRQQHGRWPLLRNDEMSWNAGLHAAHMARHGLQHAPTELLGWQRENIWCGTGIDLAGMVRHAIGELWMGHDGHRWNLLDESVSRMGIGIHLCQAGARTLYYATLVYRAV